VAARGGAAPLSRFVLCWWVAGVACLLQQQLKYLHGVVGCVTMVTRVSRLVQTNARVSVHSVCSTLPHSVQRETGVVDACPWTAWWTGTSCGSTVQK
jgi:hypothetical protein